MRSCRVVALVLVSLLSGGCGGDSGTEPPPPSPSGDDTPTLAQVTIAGAPDSIFVGRTAQLEAGATDSNGDPMTGVTFTWTSSNDARATVTSAGLVAALDTGTVQIIAAASGHGDTAGFTLAFVPVASIRVTPAGDTVMPGQLTRVVATARNGANQVLTDRTFSYTFASSDQSVAQVDADGVVTAVGPGDATITASYDTFTATAQLLVPACTTQVAVLENDWAVAVAFGGIAPGVSLTAASNLFDATPVLYAAGLVVGTSTSATAYGQPIMQYLPATNTALPIAQVCVLNDGEWTGSRRTFARVTLGEDQGVPGLRITQETFASPSEAGVMLFRYTFRNTTTTAISGLRVGMFADWDVEPDPVNNVTRQAAGFDASEAISSDSTTFAGIRAIGGGTFSYLGWTQPDDATNTDYYAILGTGTVSSATVEGDVRHLLGRGPFTIAPGAEVRMTFALAGGGSRSIFTSALNAALTLDTSLAGE